MCTHRNLQCSCEHNTHSAQHHSYISTQTHTHTNTHTHTHTHTRNNSLLDSSAQTGLLCGQTHTHPHTHTHTHTHTHHDPQIFNGLQMCFSVHKHKTPYL